MLAIGIISLIIGILLIIYSLYFLKHIKEKNKYISEYNTQLDLLNKELQNNKEQLEEEVDKLKNNTSLLKVEQVTVEESIKNKKEQLNELQSTITSSTKAKEELSQKAFENYCEVLEKQYDEYEEEYNMYKDALETSYSNRQLELMRELDEVQKDLDSIKATRAAAIQAQTREKEIEENKDNFRLNISEVAIKDIRLLKSIQKDISNSIVIDKIIWSNYYQPLAKSKFPKIIGKDTTCGIYKITSLVTGLAYIGQSTDCCDRWKQHCKNALGVGNNNSTNKLYNAMKEDELYNFTFEILEECQNSLLDEKEKYYINLYDTYNFGLNGNRGNG